MMGGFQPAGVRPRSHGRCPNYLEGLNKPLPAELVDNQVFLVPRQRPALQNDGVGYLWHRDYTLPVAPQRGGHFFGRRGTLVLPPRTFASRAEIKCDSSRRRNPLLV